MQLTIKSLFIPVTFLLAISLAGNIYSFSLADSKEQEAAAQTKNQVTQYESELVEKKNEIASLKQDLESQEVTAPVETEETNQVAPETRAKPDELINTAHRFIEYAFENDPETYVTRKSLALNYMTESLYETLYASDGVDEEQQKIAVEIKEATVFPSDQDENEAIVFYVYEEEILSSGYKEQKEMYVKISFTVEGNQLKAAEIQPLENEYGGI